MSEERKVSVLTEDSQANAQAAALEGWEQKMAFEVYYKMGGERSLEGLAKQIGKGERTVKDWSSKYRWVSRIKEREFQSAKFMEMQESAKEEADRKHKHLQILDGAIAVWAKKLKDKEIQIKSVDDLDKLINLRYKLAGMPDRTVMHHHHHSGGQTVDLRLREMDKSELQKFLHSTLEAIQRVVEKPKPRDEVMEAEFKEVGMSDEDLEKQAKRLIEQDEQGVSLDLDEV